MNSLRMLQSSRNVNQSIIGIKNWLGCGEEDPGYQSLTDEEIIEKLQKPYLKEKDDAQDQDQNVPKTMRLFIFSRWWEVVIASKRMQYRITTSIENTERLRY